MGVYQVGNEGDPRPATIHMTKRCPHPTPENKRHAAEILADLFTPIGDRLGDLQRQPAHVTS